MNYKFMSSEEVEISKIKNIRYIMIYDLFDNPWNKDRAVTAVMIEYIDDKNKVKYLNYCEKDNLFDLYIKKIMQVYMIEKNNHQIIYGNEVTRNILENHLSIGHELPCNEYLEKKGTAKILNYAKDEVNGLKNIVFYYIKQINILLGNSIEIEDKIYGNRENFCLKVINNNTIKYIPFSYTKEKDGIVIKLNNLTSALDFIVLKIKYLSTKIEITWSMPSTNLLYTASITNEKKMEETLLSSNRVIFYNNVILENPITEKERENLKNIDENIDGDFIKLPWNDFLVCKKNSEKYSDYFIETCSLKYISLTDSFINLIDVYDKFYKKYNGETLISVMRLDGMKRVKKIYLVNGYATIENSFYEVPHSLGKYKDYLEGKTFYEVARLEGNSSTNLGKIVLNDVDLSMVKHKNDLLDDRVLKLMIKRD